jgi:hypothetical protein
MREYGTMWPGEARGTLGEAQEGGLVCGKVVQSKHGRCGGVWKRVQQAQSKQGVQRCVQQVQESAVVCVVSVGQWGECRKYGEGQSSGKCRRTHKVWVSRVSAVALWGSKSWS